MRRVIGQPLDQLDAQTQAWLPRGLVAPQAPVRDTDHDLIVRRLALAKEIAVTTWIRVANDVPTRLRHGKLNIPERNVRHVQLARNAATMPRMTDTAPGSAALTKLLPAGTDAVGAEPPRISHIANHPHYDGSTAGATRLWDHDAQRGVGHALPEVYPSSPCRKLSSVDQVPR